MPEKITVDEYKKAADTRKKRRRIEDKIQREIVKNLRQHFPHLLVFAVPNGGSRNRIEAANMKKTGTLAGVADLVICWRGDDGRGLSGFLEVKAPGGDQHQEQKDFEAVCAALGLPYALVRSIGEAIEELKLWRAI